MNYQIRNIAVAVDFSVCSLKALDAAAAQARRVGARLHLLHVSEQPADEARIGTDALHTMTALEDAVRQRFELYPELIHLNGPPCVAIIDWCKEHSCDLLFIGSHGWSGSRKHHIGTTAYSLIKFSRCPVLLVPASYKDLCFDKVLFALRPAAGTVRLLGFVRLLLDHHARVEILPHRYKMLCYTKNICRLMVEEAGETLEGIELGWTAHWGNGEAIAQDTLSAARCINAGLLVLTPSLSDCSRIGYVDAEVQQIINNANIPVLYLMNCQLFSPPRPTQNMAAAF